MKKKLININSILNAKLIEEPWPHYIVDDVVNLDFSKLSSFIRDDNLYNRLHEEFKTYLPSILDKFKPVRLDKDDEVFVDLRFMTTPPNDYGGIHGDNRQKVWTLIIYVWPKKSSGTVLWTNVSLDENGDIVESDIHSEIDWKVNRAIFFSPGDEKDGWVHTPHQIINASKEIGRLTLMFNVYKSEHNGTYSEEKCEPFSTQPFDDYELD